MVEWILIFTPQAQKDAKKISQSGYRSKVEKIFEILKKDPYQNPPSFEKLIGDLAGACSRRINIKHRLVYEVLEKKKIIKIIRMWSHYE